MRRLILSAAIFFATSIHAAELMNGNMSIGFDYSEIDMRKDEHHFEGNVSVNQGAMSITSDRATAEGAQTDKSRWTFERNVHVHTSDADLKAATAVANVAKGTLSTATVKGAPAVFEQRNATADKQVRGRAGQIDYDFARGIVKLTNDVWFTYGGNEFRGAVVVYDLRQEKVIVNPPGSNQGRVNITVRPRPSTDGARVTPNAESGS